MTPAAEYNPSQPRRKDGRWGEGPDILDRTAYEDRYGTVHEEADVEGTDLAVRIFTDGQAHIVRDLDGDRRQVYADLDSTGTAMGVAADLEWAANGFDQGIDADTRDEDGFVYFQHPERDEAGISVGVHWEDDRVRLAADGHYLEMPAADASELAAVLTEWAGVIDETKVYAFGDNAAGRQAQTRHRAAVVDRGRPVAIRMGRGVQAWLDAGLARNVQLAADLRAKLAAEGRESERRPWYRIENSTDLNRAVVYLYEEIGMWGTTAADFAVELSAVTAPTIELHVNSPGGEVFDGVAIYSTLHAHPARVEAIVDGYAASAASFIVQAADSIVMMRGSTMMIHDASTWAWGNCADIRRTADLLDLLSDTIADIYMARAGKSVAHWRGLMQAETWMTAAECVALGLADEVGGRVDPVPAEGEGQATDRWDLSMYRYAGRAAAPAPGALAAEPVAEPAAVEPAAEPAVETDIEPVTDQATEPIVDDYDPAQRRADDGKWTDGMPSIIATEAVQMLNGSIAVDAPGRGEPGWVHISDGQHTAVLDDATAERLSNGIQDLREEMDVGETQMRSRYETRDGKPWGVPLYAVTKTGPARYELKVADPDDSFDDLVERTGIQMTYKQFRELEDSTYRMSAARRVSTNGGPVDFYPDPNDRMGVRVKRVDGDVQEMSFSEKEWAKIRRAINVVYEGFDESEVPPADAPDDWDSTPVSEINVSTGAGLLTVVNVDGVLSIAATNSDDWHITWPTSSEHPIWDAFDAVETANGIDIWAVLSPAGRALRAASRQAPAAVDPDGWAALVSALTPDAPAVLSADAPEVEDPWPALVAGLTTNQPSTEDVLASLREAM